MSEQNFARGLRRRFHAKERVETESIFVSVDDQERLANIKLRNRLVWTAIGSLAVELLFMFLHSASLIVLPDIAVKAISGMMAGSSFGLNGLLFYIARDLFRRR
jgi:hypothetical protein